MLPIGLKAPDFKLRSYSGEIVRLRELLSKGPVILSFFPDDFAKTHTKDTYIFLQHLLKAKSLGANVVIISPKEMIELQKIIDLYNYTISITIDSSLEVCRNYRAIWLRGLALRNLTYVIDKNGIIRGIQNHQLWHEKPWNNIMNLLKELRKEYSLTKE